MNIFVIISGLNTNKYNYIYTDINYIPLSFYLTYKSILIFLQYEYEFLLYLFSP